MNIVGTDIGGTFTDLVGCVDGKIVTSKTSTVPADPTEGVATSLRLAGCDMQTLTEVLHGSTIAINTVLERKGARTALITTRGFRDVYAIGRGNRIEAFNLFFHRPKPLIAREFSYEIDERVNAAGDVLTELDEASVEAVLEEIRAKDIQAVAVCLLHAYANPDHERRVGEMLRKARPDIFVTLSHEILREYREYERTSTTALNAFIGPRVKAYLGRLEDHLRAAEFGGKIHIMRSNGGVMSINLAQGQPVSMMESGPVAGMIGAGRLASLLDYDRCIGFDMGGTTAKSSLITDGAPAIEEGYVIGDHASGQPMQLPVVDIVEVGAGGGSIAWIDEGGGAHVGPQSAGADPGPACYGKGNTDPVVTDANLVLGRINAKRFLNGGMPLDVEASRRAIQEKIAGPLGLSVEEAALGIIRIADSAMSLSVRAVSVNKGVDPRDTAMIAFGGGGPLHASSIAREIFIPTVIIPKLPGTFSALGMLMASWRQDFVRTLIGRLGSLDAATVRTVYEELEASGHQHLQADGISADAARFEFFADLRYVGQEHAIPIPISAPEDLTEGHAALKAAFDVEHEQRYSQSAPDESMEVVNVRLIVTSDRADTLAERWLSEPWTAEAERQDETRQVIFDKADKPLDARIVWRPALKAGDVVEGPAVIEEQNSTTLVAPGDVVTVADTGHLIIRIGLFH
ncbi:hydantoinase/oxoprolinase family protein [Mesorhizobium sp. CAU 1741]|uniref:hydantoinase/oxoprolinase family protein n=1 Tax=Mesorhizobium sp. CAU 1741 TaxID=3140366 RepID=UPI00325B9761